MEVYNKENACKVSIIMSVYNTDAKFLTQSIDSVLKQSYRDFEFIIIDDNSNEETRKILENVNDDRVVLYRNEVNKGLTKNLNFAISKAKGTYIARMDSDDVCEINRIEKQVHFLESNLNIGIVATKFSVFDGENEYDKELEAIHPKNIKANLFFGNNNIMHASVMFRKAIINSDNGLMYDEDIKKSQDYDLWVRATRITDIFILSEKLMKYRISKNQISNICSEEQNRYREQTLMKQLQELNVIPTKDEVDLHKKFVKAEKVRSVKGLYKWVKKLSESNKSVLLFDNNIFDYYLYTRSIRSALKSVKSINDVGFFVAFVFKLMEIRLNLKKCGEGRV